MISVVQKRKSTPGVGRQQNTAMGAVTAVVAAAATGTNQNKRAPQQAKKKTKSSSNNKKCAQNQQQQQQPQMVQMNNQNNQANDEQVWIFGLINNIEQLLATFNSVNNQSSLQQQQQQHLSFSNKSPPSGYSTPSTMSSPFILSSSSCSSNSSAQSTSNSPVCSPKVSQLSSSSLYANSSNQSSLFGSPGPGQQQQQQVLGLHQSNITTTTTTTNTNHQQQLPRSPISRQIKFHEYKGPPQVKRPANHSNQKQSNGSTSQKAPASSSSSLSSSATSNTSSGVQGNAGNGMATNQAPLAVRGQSGGDCNNNNNQRADCVQVLDVNSLENVKQMSSISHQQQQTPTTLCLNKMTSPSGNNQLIPSQTMIQGPQQPALFRVVPAAPAEGVQIISSSHQQQQQRQQTIFVSPTSEMLNCGQQQQFVVLQEQPQQQQQYQPHLASSDFTYSALNQFGQQATFAYGAPSDELAMTEPTQQFASSVASTLGHDESSDQFVDNFSLMGQMEPSDQDHNDDDDTCDIEPTICFSNGQSGANYDETLLFSEYIDMQDIPMNVDESDWLKKFLPPCSMS